MREMTFNNQGSTTYLVIKLDPFEQTDRLAMGMMTNNTIPGLLPISPRRINRDSYLYYGISAMTPLKAAYAALASDKRLMVFLRSFCRVLRECEEYLMDPNKLMLDPEYVYIQQTTGEMYGVYLPVDGEASSVSPYQFVKLLMEQVIAAIPQNSKLLPLLYRMTISESNFSVQELDEQLAKMQTDGMLQSDPGNTRGYIAPAVSEAPKAQYAVPVPTPEPVAEVKPQEKTIQKTEPDAPQMNFPKVEKKAAKPEKSAKPFMGSLFGSSKKAEKPAPEPAFSFAVPGRATAEPIPGEEVPQTPASPVIESPFPKVSVASPFKKKSKPEPEAPIPQPAAPAPQQEKPVKQNTPVQSAAAGGYTFNLGSMDSGMSTATALMSDGNAGSAKSLWLVRRSSGQQMPVSHNNFHIGRGQDLVDFYVATATAYMGTDHAYIVIHESQYYIVDNNSRNHTWLNGQMLEPSKPYSIRPGDVLRLADEYFDVTTY